jgi:hypothetical protein
LHKQLLTDQRGQMHLLYVHLCLPLPPLLLLSWSVLILRLQIRESGVPAVVVRPCALTEEPAGAPLELDQGDVIKVRGLGGHRGDQIDVQVDQWHWRGCWAWPPSLHIGFGASAASGYHATWYWAGGVVCAHTKSMVPCKA